MDVYGYIEEYDLLSQKTRKIAPQRNVMYGTMHHLFKTTKNDDVIGSFGGDGCGAFGEIRLVTASETKVVTPTGGGCSEHPRRLGSLTQEDKLVLISVEKDGWDPEKGERVDKLYTKDVYTGGEKILMDLKPYVDTLKSYLMDEKTQKITLVFSDGVWTINAVTGEVESKEDTSKAHEESYYTTVHNGKSYYIENEAFTDNFNMILHVTDLKTRKEVEKINWGKKYPLTGDATIIGFWHDHPLISLHIYPKN